MRVLLVSGSRSLLQLLRPLLRAQAVPATEVTLPHALAARDVPVVLYYTEKWDETATATVAELAANRAVVWVICPEATHWAVRLDIVVGGAADAFPDETAALRVLAFQVRRLVGASPPGRLEWGPLTLDTEKRKVSTAEQEESLTPGEVQVLATLWTAYRSSRATWLSLRRLAALAKLPEHSVRNHVQNLREKLAALLGDAEVLQRRSGGGYRLELGLLGNAQDRGDTTSR